MKKNYGIFVLLSVAMGLTACDDGSIPRKEHGYAHRLCGQTDRTHHRCGQLAGILPACIGRVRRQRIRDYASARQPRCEQQREPHPA